MARCTPPAPQTTGGERLGVGKGREGGSAWKAVRWYWVRVMGRSCLLSTAFWHSEKNFANVFFSASLRFCIPSSACTREGATSRAANLCTQAAVQPAAVKPLHDKDALEAPG